MGKKTYHIVDPDTGEVVGKKRVGWLGQMYYKTSPKNKIFFVFFVIGIVCMFFTFACLCLAAIYSDTLGNFFGVAAIIIALICVICLILCGGTRNGK